jgi:hypothetical protein
MSITGPGTFTFIGASTTHNHDAVAQQAQTDETNAYNTLALVPFTSDFSGRDLGSSGTLPIGKEVIWKGAARAAALSPK